MARYMLTQPAFLPDGFYRDASPESPLIINVPDDMPPSLTWTPLDGAAEDALELLVAEKVEAHVASGTPKRMAERMLVAKPMPKGAERAPKGLNLDIEPRKAATPEQINQAAFDNLMKQVEPAQGQTEVTIETKTKAKRPSDAEPK